ncbi:hypothetical protein [Verrucosispora sp. NA02020]|uniref:hypothetical protein n=1 Tax=Verrucosispora sp. NA02020 TaxID=2742132 RepID=UPI001590644D|nr:hypothetical protein [Verrucosispora sp. NA02020]QKW17600.1 hypothetical protein HUT12_32355 [Verrucosispora sp. NA02020]
MIRVRIVADDVDELHAAARAIGQVLTVTQESRPRPRRSGDGVSLYLDIEMPPVKVDAADKADPFNQCGRGKEGCGQYVPLKEAARCRSWSMERIGSSVGIPRVCVPNRGS